MGYVRDDKEVKLPAQLLVPCVPDDGPRHRAVATVEPHPTQRGRVEEHAPLVATICRVGALVSAARQRRGGGK